MGGCPALAGLSTPPSFMRVRVTTLAGYSPFFLFYIFSWPRGLASKSNHTTSPPRAPYTSILQISMRIVHAWGFIFFPTLSFGLMPQLLPLLL